MRNYEPEQLQPWRLGHLPGHRARYADATAAAAAPFSATTVAAAANASTADAASSVSASADAASAVSSSAATALATADYAPASLCRDGRRLLQRMRQSSWLHRDEREQLHMREYAAMVLRQPLLQLATWFLMAE